MGTVLLTSKRRKDRFAQILEVLVTSRISIIVLCLGHISFI